MKLSIFECDPSNISFYSYAINKKKKNFSHYIHKTHLIKIQFLKKKLLQLY